MSSLFGPPLGASPSASATLPPADETTINQTLAAVNKLLALFPPASFDTSGLLRVDLAALGGQAAAATSLAAIATATEISADNLAQIATAVITADTATATGTSLGAVTKTAATAATAAATNATAASTAASVAATAATAATAAAQAATSAANLAAQVAATAATSAAAASTAATGAQTAATALQGEVAGTGSTLAALLNLTNATAPVMGTVAASPPPTASAFSLNGLGDAILSGNYINMHAFFTSPQLKGAGRLITSQTATGGVVQLTIATNPPLPAAPVVGEIVTIE